MSDTSANNPQNGASGRNENDAGASQPEQDPVIRMDDFVASKESSEGASSAQKDSEKDPASEWKQRVSYLSAEIENMRKRFVREKQDVIRFANEELLKRLLPVLDNLEFAMKATKDADAKLDPAVREHTVYVNLVKGLDMTLKHFEQSLESCGCQTVTALASTFDPNCHEALGQSQEKGIPDNQVTNVLQRGFTLGGRVLRPARVIVNKAGN